MPSGISLHIGLNAVDPKQYSGWSGELSGCEFDAKDMRAIAKRHGFATTLRMTKSATRNKILGDLKRAAKKLRRNDILFLTYSGHGGQVPNTGNDFEPDGFDETWCLYDGELIDDELYSALGSFAAGVRIFVLSDSCDSGTVLREARFAALGVTPARPRMMPRDIDLRELNPNFGGSRAVREKFMGRNGSTKKLGAAMSLREHRTENEYDKAPSGRPGPYMPVVMTACEEGGYAYEYHHGAIGHGVFTYALAKEFRKARQAGVSFNELRIRVNTVMKNLRYDQTSNVEGPRKICAGPMLAAPRKR